MNRTIWDYGIKTDRVALFLAVLELTKSGRTCLSDDGTMIYMKDRAALLAGKRQRRREEQNPQADSAVYE